MSDFIVIDVNDMTTDVAAAWLSRAEGVHQQLRPSLPMDYANTMSRVFRGGGRMCVAAGDAEVLGVAVYRMYEKHGGRHAHVRR